MLAVRTYPKVHGKVFIPHNFPNRLTDSPCPGGRWCKIRLEKRRNSTVGIGSVVSSYPTGQLALSTHQSTCTASIRLSLFPLSSQPTLYLQRSRGFTRRGETTDPTQPPLLRSRSRATNEPIRKLPRRGTPKSAASHLGTSQVGMQTSHVRIQIRQSENR